MKEFLYMIVGWIAEIHSYLMRFNDSYEYNFSDKELHFIVIGLLGMAFVFIVYPVFKWLAKHNHVMVIAWIYVFTLILVITFAIEYLPRRLVYQRPHYIERYVVPTQQVRSQSVTMIHKIASKYCRQMETAASFRTHLLHPVRNRTRQLFRLCKRVGGGCFHKNRNLLEIHRAIFRKRLHGI